jgi:membrane associated rhomboid family serine protease
MAGILLPYMQIIGPLGLSVIVGLLAYTIWQSWPQAANHEVSSADTSLHRVYRQTATTRRRQYRLLFCVQAHFLILPLWYTIDALFHPMPNGWLVVGALDVFFAPFFLLLGWLVIRGMTTKVVLAPDHVAVVTAFGQKSLWMADIAGARLEQGLYPAVDGTSWAWLGQQGILAIVPNTPRGRPLYVPSGTKADAAFDAWAGELTILKPTGAASKFGTPGSRVKDASPESATPRPRLPKVTFALLALLVTVFAAEHIFAMDPSGNGLTVGTRTLVAFGGVSRVLVVDNGQWFRLLTAVFLHHDVLHLVMNGIVLGLAGFLLELRIGRAWFLCLFVLGGLGGSLLSITLNPPQTNSVGASGAIMALIAAAFVLTFQQKKKVAERLHEQIGLLRLLIPALLPSAASHHVDVAAHLGGAVTGAALAIVIMATWEKEPSRPRLRGLAMGMVIACLPILAVGLGPGVTTAFLFSGYLTEDKQGIEQFTKGQYTLAASHFEAVVRALPAWAYGVLFLHIARHHAGQNDAEEFAANAARIDLSAWPGPALALYRRQAVPDMVWAAARSAEEKKNEQQTCEAAFYIGEWNVMNDQIELAEPLLQQAVATCPSDFIEHQLATAEKARLEQAHTH